MQRLSLLVRVVDSRRGPEAHGGPVVHRVIESASCLDVAAGVACVLRYAYEQLRRQDARWNAPFDEVELLVNPNGPLINGGSDGDNGQTGRKLVVDYYGPRVAIGGGALAGKDFSHIDRAAAYAARHAAVHAVQGGARECRVTLAFAPNGDAPLDVVYEMEGRGPRCTTEWFTHSSIRARYRAEHFTDTLARGHHFFDGSCIWNQLATSRSNC